MCYKPNLILRGDRIAIRCIYKVPTFAEPPTLPLRPTTPVFPAQVSTRARAGFSNILAALTAVFIVSQAAHGQILTPSPPAYPIINGPDVFGVRPGNLFLYYVPVTGSSTMTYGANSLPAGISINAGTGEITGTISAAGTYMTTLTASNSYGTAQKSFRIVCGPTIALTPAMGWNSWNAFGSGVTQSDLLATGSAFVNDNLTKYGWIYVNCDDTWQAERSGTLNALTGDTSTFPNIASMYAQLHAMGLKCGTYSSPWAQSYGHHPAETAENPQGTWVVDDNPELVNDNLVPWAVCRYSFVQNDVTQWAEWGIDYLKYDWNPIEFPETQLMYNTLAASGRDIIFSLSNSTPFSNVQSLDTVANSYRTDGDIGDSFSSVTGEISNAAKWAPYAAPGHWSDPDMLEIGNGGLTDNEETTHISMWCMLEAPLLLGTNMTKIGSFELSLCTNAEVIALDQDALGNQAVPVAGSITSGSFCVYEKHLEDGSIAVALVNTGTTASANATATWSELGISGSQTVVDLWRQQSQGVFDGSYSYTVPAGDTQLVRIYPPLMISTISAQEIAPGTSTAPIYLTVTDSQAAISTEVVTATSSNPTLVPQGGLSLSGSGASWILTVTPTPSLTGSCTISMMVNDGISTATNSFNLTVNTPPSISAIPWQMVNENTTVGPLSFTVSDQYKAASSLVVTATSTNNTMVPTGNITLGGSGTNRTVTVTPANNTGGTATIIVSVSDGIDTRWSAFPIWIYLPTISSGAAQSLASGSASSPIPFTIGDSRVEPYILTMSATSSNTALIPSSGLTWSGTGTIRSLTITPAVGVSGSCTVTAMMSDGVNIASSTFPVTIGTNPNLLLSPFDNHTIDEYTTAGPIALMLEGSGTLEITASSSNPSLVSDNNIVVTPSTDPWSNTDVGTVDVAGYTIPGDIMTQQASGADIYGTADAGQIAYQNVSGDGQLLCRVMATGTVNAWSKAGVMMRSSTASNAAYAYMLASYTEGVSLQYRTSNGAGANQLLNVPSISAPVWVKLVKSGTNFTGFYAPDDSGTPGTWTQLSGTGGSSVNINIYSSGSNYIEGLMSTAHDEAAGVVGISTYDMISGSNTGTGVLNTGANESVTITPNPDTSGSSFITLILSSGSFSTTSSFELQVNGPTINDVPGNQSIDVNTNTGALSFTVGDNLVAPANLTVTGTSPDNLLLPMSGLVVSGSGATRTITVTPALNQVGSGNVLLSVNDGSVTSTGTFGVTVTATPDQSWRLQYFGTAQNTGNAADLANPAGDGVVNLVKYALGMNPDVNSQAGLPVLSASGGALELKFNRNLSATDVTYYIQASDNMVTWTTLATWAAGGNSWTQTGATVTDVNGAVTAVDNTPIGSQPHRFLQLQVSGP